MSPSALRGDKERELRDHATSPSRRRRSEPFAAERARIARELHDVVSHAIAVTVLQARAARKMVGRDDETVRARWRAIEHTNTAALADMRHLLALLRTPRRTADPEPAPSLERLDHLVEQVRESGLPVDVAVTGDPLPLPPGLDLSAYRIVQEALTNVLKHAGPGARACVDLGYGADELEVSVTTRDDGRAPGRPARTRADRHPGAGLGGGGQVDAGPADGGYAVRARLPYLLELVDDPRRCSPTTSHWCAPVSG